jgi:hypothetical protein
MSKFKQWIETISDDQRDIMVVGPVPIQSLNCRELHNPQISRPRHHIHHSNSQYNTALWDEELANEEVAAKAVEPNGSSSGGIRRIRRKLRR